MSSQLQFTLELGRIGRVKDWTSVRRSGKFHPRSEPPRPFFFNSPYATDLLGQRSFNQRGPSNKVRTKLKKEHPSASNLRERLIQQGVYLIRFLTVNTLEISVACVSKPTYLRNVIATVRYKLSHEQRSLREKS